MVKNEIAIKAKEELEKLLLNSKNITFIQFRSR